MPTEPTADIPGTLLELDGRVVRLLGTAHVSASSCADVETAIRAMRPDAVLVELDAGRLTALRDRNAWAKTDIREVLRKGQLPALIASLVLSSYQRRLGGDTGVRPGAELLRAVEVAEAEGIPVVLCDRPIKLTLRRIWATIGYGQRLRLAGALVASLFSSQRITEADLGELKKADTINAMLAEMGTGMPQLAQVLVSERDWYMAEHIQAASGTRVLAVVGAAHVPGMTAALRAGRRSDLAALEQVPKRSLAFRMLPWALSALVIGALAVVVAMKWQSNQFDVLGAARLWVMCTSGPAVVAALIVRAHILVVLLIAVAAPFAALLRAIPGPKLSLLSAMLQAWLRPPTVADMEGAADGMQHLGAWWSNRLLRLLLVFIVPGLAATVGALYALSVMAG